MAKEKFKLGEAFVIVNGLSNINMKGVKLNRAIIKLKKALEEEVKVARESVVPSEKFSEYERKRYEILNKYKVDDDKNVVHFPVSGGSIPVPVNKAEKVTKELSKLDKEYADAIEERRKQLQEFDKMLEQECIEVDVIKVSDEDLPDDIDTSTLDLLATAKIVDL